MLGVAIAVAIALHNIPEGISVSVPIFYATGDRKKAFTYSLLSGLSEPVGAGIAYLVLILLLGGTGADVPQELMGILFAGVAGIMVYISLDELLPTSRAYGKGHDSLYGLVARHAGDGAESGADEVRLGAASRGRSGLSDRRGRAGTPRACGTRTRAPCPTRCARPRRDRT